MASPESPELAKVERLAIAGKVAPVLRGRAGAPRKVTLVGKDGKPTGTTTDIEVAQSLLARSEIEFSVQDGKRPAFVNCKTCGRPVKVQKRGKVPTVCKPMGCSNCGGRVKGRAGECSADVLCAVCAPGTVRRFTDEEVLTAIAACGGFRAAARALGVDDGAVRARARKLGVSSPLVQTAQRTGI